MFLAQAVSRIKNWSGLRIILATLIVSQIGTFAMVSPMSVLFHGEIRSDYLVTGVVTGFVVALVVGSILAQLIPELAALAQHDALTGLPNRAMFSERVGLGLAIASRSKTKLALLYIDLDKFKPINDTHGHAVGDQVLLSVSKRISACLRDSDTVGRIGGDEFVVLLLDVVSEEAACRVAEKIRAALKSPFEMAEGTFDLSASIGLAIYPDHGVAETELAGHADVAMYRAKMSGRDNVQCFRPEMLTDPT